MAKMTQKEPVGIIIKRVYSAWKSTHSEIVALTDDIKRAVGLETFKRHSSSIDENLNDFSAALQRLLQASKEPEVVVATTGTTSSGKSTLANMLIGEILLPKAVQEMSAGVVTILHCSDPSQRQLTIEKTAGASWETKTWTSISAEEVQSRLETVMETYRKLIANHSSSISPPIFKIVWPTLMGLRAQEFGLPQSAKLTIVDLPGLKYVNDEINGKVVREQVKRALCLVTYNSFETDPVKQESLLNQITDQVKSLGGSPARMLFVLNRIDAYLSERDHVASENKFKNRVTDQIRSHLLKVLPEYEAEIMKINPEPLSSEPALYSILAEKLGPEADEAYLRKLSKDYAPLFPDKKMDELDRVPRKWTINQRRWFIQEARHQSHLDNFENALGRHIAENLPEIIVPSLISEIYNPARKVLECLDAFIKAYSLEEEGQVNEATIRLNRINQQLKNIKLEAIGKLNPIVEVVKKGGGDLDIKMPNAIKKVEEALEIPTKLTPLVSAVFEAIDQPLNRLNDFIFRYMNGEDNGDVSIHSIQDFAKLKESLDALRETEYGKNFQTGCEFEDKNADFFLNILKGFAKSVSDSASSLIQRESLVQAERLNSALIDCSNAVIKLTESSAIPILKREGFSGLIGIFNGQVELKPPLLPRVVFEANPEKWSRTEAKPATVTEWVEKRVWWKLWLGTSTVPVKKQIVIKTIKQGIYVGKLGDLIDGFRESAQVSEIIQMHQRWFIGSLDEFDSLLSKRLDEGMASYREALSLRLEEIKQGSQVRIQNLEFFDVNLERAQQNLKSCCDWRSF
jgi:GTPase Era involved in 16S rRNA processing